MPQMKGVCAAVHELNAECFLHCPSMLTFVRRQKLELWLVTAQPHTRDLKVGSKV